MLAAVTGAVVYAEARPITSGVLAAAAVGLKLPALLLVLYFLRARQLRPILVLGLSALLLEALVFVRYGVSGGLLLHDGWRAILSDTTSGYIMITQGWIPLMLIATGLEPRYGMVALQAVGSLLIVALLLATRASRTTWFCVLALAMAALSPLCWNPNYVLAWPALTLAWNRAETSRRRWLVVGTGVLAAIVLTTLTPGIETPEIYETWLARLRPYGVFSLVLVGYTLSRRTTPG
jgi:hypothetical protein